MLEASFFEGKRIRANNNVGWAQKDQKAKHNVEWLSKEIET